MPSARHVTVSAGGQRIADSSRAYRVLETSHPPGWYVPPVDATGLRRSSAPATRCEWKGVATYWDVVVGGRVLPAAAWSYEAPTPGFLAITGYLAFLPAMLECRVDGELAAAQDGGFYGGWITAEVLGPFKGGPGTWGW